MGLSVTPYQSLPYTAFARIRRYSRLQLGSYFCGIVQAFWGGAHAAPLV